MANQYVNKVVQSDGTTLIDITDTTATASDVAVGKYFYAANGQKMSGTSSGGGGGTAIIVDTEDSHGGTVRSITTTDEVYLQSNKTVTPSASAQTILPDSGYNGLTQLSVEAIPSQYIVPSGTYSITENGTYNVEAFARAEVMVSGGGGGGISVDDIALRTISGGVSGNASMIASYAFYSCNNLISASFPSCTTIYSYAFAQCYNLASIYFPTCASIGWYAFRQCSNLTSINFPSCTNIEPYAFENCLGLTSTIDFPLCTSIGNNAFYSCSGITSVNFPVCREINGSAFYFCRGLIGASFPVCGYIASYAFYSCNNLISASFPSCTVIYPYTFYGCSSLNTISFPTCTSIGSYAFRGCIGLTSAYFPVCGIVSTSAFYSCQNLVTANFPLCKSIYSYAFGSCVNLSVAIMGFSSTTSGTIREGAFTNCNHLLSLYLIGNMPFTLSGSAVFKSTPISDYTTSTGGVYGSIFVPASLYDTYISATNWVTYSSRFVSLTDTEIQNVIDYGTHEP